MKYANNEGLSVREKIEIIFLGPTVEVSKRFLTQEIKENDKVYLKKQKTNIIVEKAKLYGAGFVGLITGFDPPATEFQNLKVNDEISFFDYHVFSCHV
jgi:hypothetical protein